jgi:nucleoside-diphosphate-sugar epimerase
MPMRKISILGCGWLGFPLAKKLVEKGFSLNGSTTSENKLSLLKQFGIEPFLVKLSENAVEGKIVDFLRDSEILIIDIPPKLKGANKESFPGKIKNVLSFIEKSEVEKIVFISSTAVYADDNSVMTESTVPNPDSESGKQLLEAENIFQDHPEFETTIVRFGGLIGEDRHPIKYLAGKENLENPEAPVNLIHRDDCIGIIMNIIENGHWNNLFNAVAPFHPTRKTYYSQKANDMNLPLPKFRETTSSGKIIAPQKITEILNYEFLHPKL